MVLFNREQSIIMYLRPQHYITQLYKYYELLKYYIVITVGRYPNFEQENCIFSCTRRLRCINFSYIQQISIFMSTGSLVRLRIDLG